MAVPNSAVDANKYFVCESFQTNVYTGILGVAGWWRGARGGGGKGGYMLLPQRIRENCAVMQCISTTVLTADPIFPSSAALGRYMYPRPVHCSTGFGTT